MEIIRKMQEGNFICNTLAKWLIRIYVLGVFGTNILKLLGYVSFRFSVTQDVFYGCGLFLGSIFIYEYRNIQELEKHILIGVLLGSMASTFDERCLFLLILFLVNIMWIEVKVDSSYRNALNKFVKTVFCCMVVLEIYSICILINSSISNIGVTKSFLFDFMDIFFIIITIVFFIYNNKAKSLVCNEANQEMKNVQGVKLYTWVIMIAIIALIVVSYNYMYGNNTDDKMFFIGKAINRGYLLWESSEEEQVYFVREAMNNIEIENVINNPLIYEFIDHGKGFSLQKVGLYIGKALYVLQYGSVNWIFMTLGVMFYLLHKYIPNKTTDVNRM